MRKHNGYPLTDEQNHATDLALTGKSLKIEARAGSGKTSLMQVIASELPGRGHYLAFNKSIADEASRKFPGSVKAQTAHSMAYRACGAKYRDRLPGRNSPRLTGRMVAIALQLSDWQILPETGKRRSQTLTAIQQGYLLMGFVSRFCNSADNEILMKHAPRNELIVKSSDPTEIKAIKEQVFVNLFPRATDLWHALINPNGTLPVTHDVYLKLWALSRPIISADYILFDEYQDANGVLHGVMAHQPGQIIICGDRYQSIYGWRGAINAMRNQETENTAEITQSFRFGPEIARVGERVILHQLGEHMPLRGFEKINSTVHLKAQQNHDAILCRTNALCMSNLIDQVSDGKKAAIVGDVWQMINNVKGISALMNGQKAGGEFALFDSFEELEEYSETSQGGDIKPMIKLVLEHGATKLNRMLYEAKDIREQDADVYISTAHRAKGREWGRVMLADDFRQPPKPDEDDNGWTSEDANLLYVAATRAQNELDISGCSAALDAISDTSNTSPGMKPILIDNDAALPAF